ncbi:DUF2125 domain-containing protein [Fulvimarina sp. 2208YS6-2-32]|uniref:DUF2125 domain-containing protein n=1 Tax=Fulvimarina uroteuthidis TaxID=3098149 RepID=A0ABU5HZA9_9HYPH|nr:DUF2125 domain-containing protein [Fulvimarina sp. 2208YS6-2-32]MDY8108463.1 DUF2125 domain-containing protein [Fulvimarina sp. 2208YS6-2-32]
MPSSTLESRRVRRAYRWIVATAFVLFLILTGFWFFAAHQLDRIVTREIERAGARGVTVSCPGQDVVGYPFRIGLSCDDVAVDAPGEGFSLDAGPFRSAAQIYQPNKVVSELGSPVRIRSQGQPPVDLTWTLAQASTSFWTEGLDRLSIVSDSPNLAVDGQPVFSALRSTAHVRRREADLDIAATQTSARVEVPQARGLPLFDLSADLTVEGAAGWLSGSATGQSARELLAGRSGTLRSLALAFAGEPSGADLSGDFSFSDDGLLSGDFALAVTSPDRLATIVAGLAPQAASIAQTVASVIPFVGKTENGRTVIRITADQGRLSAGVLPLGTVPPLK